MVKLKGPSLALTAAGGLGKTIIFSQSKGRVYLKKWHQPTNPNTAPQLGMRSLTAYLSSIWGDLPTSEKNTWNTLANAANVSQLNAALTLNLQRWRRFQYPGTQFPVDETGTVQNFTAWTATAVSRAILHDIGSTVESQGRGWCLHRGPTSGFARNWDNLVRIIPNLPFTPPFIFRDRVTPGTYFYKLVRVADQGNVSPQSARGPITVT